MHFVIRSCVGFELRTNLRIRFQDKQNSRNSSIFGFLSSRIEFGKDFRLRMGFQFNRSLGNGFPPFQILKVFYTAAYWFRKPALFILSFLSTDGVRFRFCRKRFERDSISLFRSSFDLILNLRNFYSFGFEIGLRSPVSRVRNKCLLSLILKRKFFTLRDSNTR